VIEAAANQRTAYLQELAAGEHVQLMMPSCSRNSPSARWPGRRLPHRRAPGLRPC
jgi:hypothetical protein